MRVEWTRSALNDLDRLQDYIAQDSPYYAAQFANRIVGATERLLDFPESGRLVPEAQRSDVREIFVQDYRIIYALTGDAVVVLTVIHGGRDLDHLTGKPWERA